MASIWPCIVAPLVSGCPSQDVRSAERLSIKVGELDSVFPLIQSVRLQETDDYLVGAFADGAVDREGNLYLADHQQRDVKLYRNDGSILGVLGRTGKGPGEYLTPVAISASPTEHLLAVTDVAQSRVIVYDRLTRRASRTLDLASLPVRPHSVTLGLGDTMLVAGGFKTFDDPEAPIGLVSHGAGDVLRILLNRPSRLKSKPLAISVLHATGARSPTFWYLAANTDPIVYRAAHGGSLIDSIALPEAAHRPVQLPDTNPVDIRAMQKLMRSQEWIRSLTAINDTVVVIEVDVYSPPTETWRHRIIILIWNNNPVATISKPCDCRILGSLGDTLLILRGEPPDTMRVERRRLRRPDT